MIIDSRFMILSISFSYKFSFLRIIFRVFTLIAAAGLPDKKLRKYIRQIEGEKNLKEPQSDGDRAKKTASWDNVSKLDK